MTDLAAAPLTVPVELAEEPTAVDSIQAQLVNSVTWPLALTVLRQFASYGQGDDCDLVLVAVKPGRGQFVADLLADQLKVAEVPE